MYTNVQFDYGGCYAEDHKWFSKTCLKAIVFKTSCLEEISYSLLVEKIWTKIGIDEATGKLKMSYSLSKDRREVYIADDEDVLCYITSLDQEGLKPILHVELVNGVENNERMDQLSRVERESSFGVNYGELDINGRVDEMENVDNVGIRSNEKQLIEVEEERNEVEEQGNEVVEMENEDNVGILTTEEQGNEVVEMENEDNADCEGIENGNASVEQWEWEDGAGLEIRQEFSSRALVQDLVRKAANKNCFGYKTIKSDKSRVMLRCQQASKGCKWYLRAARCRDSAIWTIRKYRKMHSCSRAYESTSSIQQRGTQRLVSNFLYETFAGDRDTPPATSIVNMVQTNLSIDCSYSTALRGKKRHIAEMRGSTEKSYELLFSYLFELEKANPQTVTRVELDEKNRFKYLFIALGVSIEGFNAMRKVIVVDATFLKGKYGGMLVFATAEDPNHHHYPIAFGVIDSEKDVSWNWFFTNLKTIVPDCPELVFMSDRHQSIIKAVGRVYPSAKHAHCIWHLSQNVKAKVGNDRDGVAAKFIDCAHAYTESRFNREYTELKNKWAKAAAYLEETITVDRWARCYFDGDKYNIDTSNAAESMNSVFRKARGYPLLPMIDAIIEKMSDWFNRYRKAAGNAPLHKRVVPYVENILHARCKVAKSLKVRELNFFELEYEVKGVNEGVNEGVSEGVNGKQYRVNLRRRSCSCRCFDIDKYPCVHAIAACGFFMRTEGREESIQIYDLCSAYYFTQTWTLAYEKTIYSVPHESEWNIPEETKQLQAFPPIYTPKRGRNKEKRFPSTGEKRPKRKTKYIPSINLERWLQPEPS